MPKLKSKPAEPTRPVLYPYLTASVCTSDISATKTGECNPLTCDQAKALLGWLCPEGKDPAFEVYHFKDRNNKTVLCLNNDINRPFYPGLARQWMFEILAGNWKQNGETLIIGKTGRVLDCQHRLVGLVWAQQEWAKNPDKYPFWKTEPTIDCILVFGVNEDIKTVNTINVGKSRSVGDALYATDIFKGKPKDVKQQSRIAGHAVRMLWQRTGAMDDAFTPKQSHAEVLDFLLRHPFLIELVEFVYTLDKKTSGALQQCLSLGYLAALSYLMSIADDGGSAYHNADVPSEDDVKFKYVAQVRQFLRDLSERKPTTDALREGLIALHESNASIIEYVSITILGWQSYRQHKKVLPLTLSYAEKDGRRVLLSRPGLGGIDIGPD
jgi:hypothetical protein